MANPYKDYVESNFPKGSVLNKVKFYTKNEDLENVSIHESGKDGVVLRGQVGRFPAFYSMSFDDLIRYSQAAGEMTDAPAPPPKDLGGYEPFHQQGKTGSAKNIYHGLLGPGGRGSLSRGIYLNALTCGRGCLESNTETAGMGVYSHSIWDNEIYLNSEINAPSNNADAQNTVSNEPPETKIPLPGAGGISNQQPPPEPPQETPSQAPSSASESQTNQTAASNAVQDDVYEALITGWKAASKNINSQYKDYVNSKIQSGAKIDRIQFYDTGRVVEKATVLGVSDDGITMASNIGTRNMLSFSMTHEDFIRYSQAAGEMTDAPTPPPVDAKGQPLYVEAGSSGRLKNQFHGFKGLGTVNGDRGAVYVNVENSRRLVIKLDGSKEDNMLYQDAMVLDTERQYVDKQFADYIAKTTAQPQPQGTPNETPPTPPAPPEPPAPSETTVGSADPNVSSTISAPQNLGDMTMPNNDPYDNYYDDQYNGYYGPDDDQNDDDLLASIGIDPSLYGQPQQANSGIPMPGAANLSNHAQQQAAQAQAQAQQQQAPQQQNPSANANQQPSQQANSGIPMPGAANLSNHAQQQAAQAQAQAQQQQAPQQQNPSANANQQAPQAQAQQQNPNLVPPTLTDSEINRYQERLAFLDKLRIYTGVNSHHPDNNLHYNVTSENSVEMLQRIKDGINGQVQAGNIRDSVQEPTERFLNSLLAQASTGDLSTLDGMLASDKYLSDTDFHDPKMQDAIDIVTKMQTDSDLLPVTANAFITDLKLKGDYPYAVDSKPFKKGLLAGESLDVDIIRSKTSDRPNSTAAMRDYLEIKFAHDNFDKLNAKLLGNIGKDQLQLTLKRYEDAGLYSSIKASNRALEQDKAYQAKLSVDGVNIADPIVASSIADLSDSTKISEGPLSDYNPDSHLVYQQIIDSKRALDYELSNSLFPKTSAGLDLTTEQMADALNVINKEYDINMMDKQLKQISKNGLSSDEWALINSHKSIDTLSQDPDNKLDEIRGKLAFHIKNYDQVGNFADSLDKSYYEAYPAQSEMRLAFDNINELLGTQYDDSKTPTLPAINGASLNSSNYLEFKEADANNVFLIIDSKLEHPQISNQDIADLEDLEVVVLNKGFVKGNEFDMLNETRLQTIADGHSHKLMSARLNGLSSHRDYTSYGVSATLGAGSDIIQQQKSESVYHDAVDDIANAIVDGLCDNSKPTAVNRNIQQILSSADIKEHSEPVTPTSVINNATAASNTQPPNPSANANQQPSQRANSGIPMPGAANLSNHAQQPPQQQAPQQQNLNANANQQPPQQQSAQVQAQAQQPQAAQQQNPSANANQQAPQAQGQQAQAQGQQAQAQGQQAQAQGQQAQGQGQPLNSKGQPYDPNDPNDPNHPKNKQGGNQPQHKPVQVQQTQSMLVGGAALLGGLGQGISHIGRAAGYVIAAPIKGSIALAGYTKNNLNDSSDQAVINDGRGSRKKIDPETKYQMVQMQKSILNFETSSQLLEQNKKTNTLSVADKKALEKDLKKQLSKFHKSSVLASENLIASAPKLSGAMRVNSAKFMDERGKQMKSLFEESQKKGLFKASDKHGEMMDKSLESIGAAFTSLKTLFAGLKSSLTPSKS